LIESRKLYYRLILLR